MQTEQLEEVNEMLAHTQAMLTKLPLDVRVHLLSVLSMLASCYFEEKNHAVLVFVEDDSRGHTMLMNATPSGAQYMLSEVLPTLAQVEKDYDNIEEGELH